MNRNSGPVFWGVGIDITEVRRIRQLCRKTPSFPGRFFTDEEIAYCRKGRNFYERLAARFSAKEAVIKALNRKDLPLKSISVANTASGKPEIELTSPGMKGFRVMVSLSHTADYACASAVALQEVRRSRK